MAVPEISRATQWLHAMWKTAGKNKMIKTQIVYIAYSFPIGGPFTSSLNAFSFFCHVFQLSRFPGSQEGIYSKRWPFDWDGGQLLKTWHRNSQTLSFRSLRVGALISERHCKDLRQLSYGPNLACPSVLFGLYSVSIFLFYWTNIFE